MPNPLHKYFSVRAVLFLLLLVVLVPALAIQGYIYHDRFQYRRQLAFESNLEVAHAASRAFEAFVQGILQQELAIGIAATAAPALSAADLNRLLVQSAASSPAVGHYFLVGTAGQIVASSDPAAVGLDLSDLSYFTQITDGREWVVSDLIASNITGYPVFTISRALRGEQGALLGLISASITPDNLDKILPLERTGHAGISLIDSRGMLVYRYPATPSDWEDRNWRKRYPIIEEAFQGKAVSAELAMGTPEHTCYFGLAPISSVGWVSAVCRSEQEALRPIYSALLYHAGLFVLVVLAAFAAALALARPIAASIDRLRTHAQALGRGEITHLETPAGPSELRELAEAFNGMAAKVSRREQALRESENRYRELVQNANSAIIRCGKDGTITFFNEFAQSFFGYRAEEVLGKSIRLIVPDIDSRGADLTGLVEEILAHPDRYSNHVNENILRDGRRVWMAWTNRPICDENGRVKEILTVGSDITALKLAEEARRETEERFRIVVDNLTEGLFIHAPSGRIVYHNPASVRMHGFVDLWPDLSADEAAATWEVTDRDGNIVPFENWVFRQVLDGRRIQDAVVRVRRKDGKCDFWASYRGVPIHAQDGRIRFALITVRDETSRIHAEEELREINRRLEHIVEERTAMLAKMIEELKLANQDRKSVV